MKPPIEFQQAQEIGRTHDVLGCIPIVQIVCRCHGVPLLLNGCPSQVTCGACGCTFTLRAVQCENVMVGTKIDVREASRILETVQ